VQEKKRKRDREEERKNRREGENGSLITLANFSLAIYTVK